jgi:hypothetical protein
VGSAAPYRTQGTFPDTGTEPPQNTSFTEKLTVVYVVPQTGQKGEKERKREQERERNKKNER